MDNRKILLTENVPSLNKGEVSILFGMLEGINVLGEIELSMLSSLPQVDRKRYKNRIKVIDISQLTPSATNNRLLRVITSLLDLSRHVLFLLLYKVIGKKVLNLFKNELWRAYLDADLIIMGHDASFGIGGGSGVPSIFYPVFIPLFSKALRKPTMFYGGSIELAIRFKWVINRAYKFALDNIDLVTLRDRISLGNLRRIGIKNERVFVTADPAFLLKPSPPERINEIMQKEGIEIGISPLIGLTLSRERALLAFPSLGTENAYKAHAREMAVVIDGLIEDLGAFVVIVPHCIGPGRNLDDRIVAKDVYGMCQKQNKIKVITEEYDAADLKGLLGHFDFFLGERLHSVINAMGMGVPSIAISNSSDQRLDIIKMLGQDEAIYPIEGMDSQSLLAKVVGSWAIRDRIKKDLEINVESMKKEALRNGELLRDLIEQR